MDVTAFGNEVGAFEMNQPVADAEALVGSFMEQSLLLEKEKVMVLSIPSLSSVPSTILRRTRGAQRQPGMIHPLFSMSIFS